MDQAVESQIYNEIGVAVVGEIGTTETKILVYVEMTNDSFQTAIRYLDIDGKHVRGAFSTPRLSKALDDLRAHLLNQGLDKLWSSMEYVVEHGKVNVSLNYDKIDKDVPIWDRTPGIMQKHFPGLPFKSD